MVNKVNVLYFLCGIIFFVPLAIAIHFMWLEGHGSANAFIDLADQDHIAQIETAKYSMLSAFSGLFLGTMAIIISLYSYLSGLSQSRKELRAYVGTEDVKFQGVQSLNDFVVNARSNRPWHENPPRDLVYRVPFTNAGQTPAKVIATHCNACVGPFPHINESQLPVDLDLLSDHKSRNQNTSLGPGKRGLVETGLDHELTDAHIFAIREQKAAIWIYGNIEYFDMFSSKLRVTNFRFAHHLPFIGGAFTEDVMTHYHGNDAT